MLEFYFKPTGRHEKVTHDLGPIEFGRGAGTDHDDDDGSALEPASRRIAIDDPAFSLRHLRFEELPDATVRVANLCAEQPARLVEKGRTLAPGETIALRPPFSVKAGETIVRVERVAEDGSALSSAARPLTPGTLSSGPPTFATLRDLGPAPAPDRLAHWLETMIAVQRAAVGDESFFKQAARATVELIGMDRGMVLTYRNGWESVASWPEHGIRGDESSFSGTILKSLTQRRETIFQAPGASVKSLAGIEAVVASPIFGADEELIGAVYGARVAKPGGAGTGITLLEAQVVQLLASLVGSGLVRKRHQEEANRARHQFEMFFSAPLARALETNPKLLQARKCEATVLFADVRGFSTLSERLSNEPDGPEVTTMLVHDIMTQLSKQVWKHDGVVLDYMGDGLIAMWNAPAEQPDHPDRACRAALDMIAELDGLSERWRERAGEVRLGIGINTGEVVVGNIGSESKFKYGPLGHPVNIASRIEGLTKQLKVPILISDATRCRLNDPFEVRRICKGRVAGLAEPIDLYELRAEACDSEWTAFRQDYERALDAFENRRWVETMEVLSAVLRKQRPGGFYDWSCLDLASRALECIKDASAFQLVKDFANK